eukprot:NODE_871_length_1265_cov_458.801809_g666_i0.p1 GENE.NODE_871_length_1265_cov_458.801809_g666_i0~~NODE_871_length_1265_cov_458.801809_g666_i0.p1  ORF type:complete len:287 (+),score=60.93 NODE_871_length_1265_cov_458.801809_g666_i0:76-936(+)
MHRAQPIGNRVCNDKWQDRTYKNHRAKLNKIKPSIDNKAPPMYPHLYQKIKKAQMEEERCGQIERDNRTLVRRMTDIMQRSALETQNPWADRRVLNRRETRRRELMRVTQENQALLKRIQQAQPTYNHLQWEQQQEQREALCERLCQYPYQPPGKRNLAPLSPVSTTYHDDNDNVAALGAQMPAAVYDEGAAVEENISEASSPTKSQKAYESEEEDDEETKYDDDDDAKSVTSAASGKKEESDVAPNSARSSRSRRSSAASGGSGGGNSPRNSSPGSARSGGSDAE